MSSDRPTGLPYMTTFVCIHGAGGHGSDWQLVGDILVTRGHRVIAVDLPCEQDVGLDAYAETVLDAIAAAELDDPARDLVLVAQSLGGLVAPLVADRLPPAAMVLVAAMIPAPGETGHDWWTNTGHAEALSAQGLSDASPESLFTHDVSPDVLAAYPAPRSQSGALLDEAWPLLRWPEVPTHFLACSEDRFFPLSWLRPLVQDRLGIEPIVVPGGHCAILSQPRALADAIATCVEPRGQRP